MEIVRKDYFIEIIASDNEYITLWDKENIEEYSGSKIIYTPLTFDTTIIYAITEDEHNALVAEQEKIMNENREKYDNNSN